MTSNPVRRKLLDRKPTFGSWIQIGHPAVAEVLAQAGFEWLCVDLEHGAIGIEALTDVFRALAGTDCVPGVRIPKNDSVWIRRSLDAGARLLVVPMINNAAEAAAVIREAKYPPMGQRGFGYSRASAHGARFRETIASANEDIAVVLQIEHKDAIAELDTILEVPGVDGLFIGPLDLSGSMGVTGQLDHPEVVAALTTYREACRRHRKSAGMHIVHPTPQAVASNLADGYTFVALGLDTVFLGEAAGSALASARLSSNP